MTPRFETSPAEPNLDTALHLRVTGLPAGAAVTVRAAQSDLHGGRWESTIVFTADAAGVVDLPRDAPTTGSYEGVDPMGLVWAMRPLDPPSPGGPVDARRPAELRLTAAVEG